jgi:anthranilate synthase component 2
MIFVLDNYDSFTYNLVQYVGELGADPVVRRNDQVTVDEILALGPTGVIISPGPGVPEDAGISLDLVNALAAQKVPLLGVCLGHQVIGQAFGGRIVAAAQIMHGKTSEVSHHHAGVLRDLPTPFTAMRYHSLVVDRGVVPRDLQITAWTLEENHTEQIMGLQHKRLPIYGVQFHPESIGTPAGPKIVQNFLALVGPS